jgi:hypothetical protein
MLVACLTNNTDGMIKLLKGKVLKGDYDLAGSFYEQSPDSPLSLTIALANQQRTILTLLAEEESEVSTRVELMICSFKPIFR